MTGYKLYCLDDRGRIVRRHDLEAATDEDALQLARAQAPHVSRELWTGARKVAALPADASAA